MFNDYFIGLYKSTIIVLFIDSFSFWDFQKVFRKKHPKTFISISASGLKYTSCESPRLHLRFLLTERKIKLEEESVRKSPE